MQQFLAVHADPSGVGYNLNTFSAPDLDEAIAIAREAHADWGSVLVVAPVEPEEER